MDDVEPLAADRVALPAVGHRPIPLQSLLPWPWNKIFADRSLLLHPTRSKVPLEAVPVFDSFKTEEDRVKIYKTLASRRMLKYQPCRSSRLLAKNGMFGIHKSDTASRLVVDQRRGNFPLLTMQELQKVYERYLREDPDQAEGLRAKALDLFNPSSLVDLPPGGLLKTESDLSNFFHFLQVPDWMCDHQALSPILSSKIGLDPAVSGKFVVPVLTTLAMAQVVHEVLLLRSLKTMLGFRPRSRPCPAKMVPISAVPDSALRPLLRAFSCDEARPALMDPSFPVPSSAFDLEPCAIDQADFVMMGVDLRDGDSRLILSRVNSNVVAFGFFVYIDDHHCVFFGRRHGAKVVSALANARLLATVFIYVRAGLLVHPKKLRWAMPSHSPTPSLGFVVNLSHDRSEIGVCPSKIAILAARTLAVVSRARAGGSVTVGLLQHLVSSWVWCFMVRRPLLSVFARIFHKIAAKPPHWTVTPSSSICNELEMAAFLGPTAFGTTSPVLDTVGAFDASNHGFGVAYKLACPPSVRLELTARVERHGSWSAFSMSDGLPLEPRLLGRVSPDLAGKAAAWLHHDWSATNDLDWRVARSGLWSRPKPRHITLGETRAALMLVQWFANRTRSHDHSVVMCGDNQPCLGALAKGRSSVIDINRLCRRVCSIVISTGMVPNWLWLSSKTNPADGPSRWARPSSMGWSQDFARTGMPPHPGPKASNSVYKGPILRPVGSRVSGPKGLKFASVKQETAASYLRAYMGFEAWCKRHADPALSLACTLEHYVYWCYDTGEVSRQQCSNLLAGLSILRSEERKSKAFAGARRCITGWSRKVPSKPHLPIPRKVLLGCAVELVMHNYLPVAAALLLGFDCYLRHSEIQHLRVVDIAFPGDPRVQVDGVGSVFIFSTKAGRKQWVAIRCPLAMGLLRKLVTGRSGRSFLFGHSRFSLLDLFKRSQLWLGLRSAPFVMHSLRHGGASFDFINGMDIDKIIIRGRWSGLKVTRRYIQESQALVLAMALPQVALSRLSVYLAAPLAWLRV